MNPAWRLFSHKNPYDIDRTAPFFMEAMRENIELHRRNCPGYAAILRAEGFEPDRLCTEADLALIPPIPTLYFKRNSLFSLPEHSIVLRASSSGTKGAKSQVGFDRRSLFYGVVMMFRFFALHGVLSAMPANYIILNAPPGGAVDPGAVRTAYGASRFAPALHREYALRRGVLPQDALNIEGVQRALLRYAKQGFPVRFVGFPAYMHCLTAALKEKGISLRLNKRSKILLGGGWKTSEGVGAEEFYALIEETLGLKKENCLEFFSAAEHPLPYCKCAKGNFHIPAYSRVIVRDAATLRPLPHGEAGLLNFLSPLVRSMPLMSVLTDDIGALYDGSICGCGIRTPFFVLHGRAGVETIKTCAAAAAELLEGRER